MPSANDAVPWWLDALEVLPGLFVLWRVQFSAGARRRLRLPPVLQPWMISLTSFFAGVLCVLVAGMLAIILFQVAAALFPVLASNTTLGMITSMGILHTCFVGGALAAGALIKSAPDWLTDAQNKPELPPDDGRPFTGSVITAGIATFFVALSLVYPLGRLIQVVMKWRGIEIDTQVQITTLIGADSWIAVGVFSFFAIVMAPIGEELIFRAGLFRFLRTRLPRALAFVLPATVFALLHVDWQTRAGLSVLPSLAVLAIVFSFAFERTGKIAVPIIAHALFNLHTVVLVLLGVTG